MRALVLQGGGAKGAFQAGVLKHLIGDLKTHYDIVCGISVGALNAAYVSQYAAGDEAICAADLESLWLSLDNSKVRKKWFAWPLTVPWKPSVYDSKPLNSLVREVIDPSLILSSGRKLRVGAVSLEAGEYRAWTEQSADIITGVLASSAFPGGMTPVKSLGEFWIDGGVRDMTPLNEAIRLGATEVDCILLSSPTLPIIEIGKPRTLEVLIRALDIILDELASNDLERAKLYNELVDAGLRPDKRKIELNIYTASRSLGSTLDFDPKQIQKNIALGYEDARWIRNASNG